MHKETLLYLDARVKAKETLININKLLRQVCLLSVIHGRNMVV